MRIALLSDIDVVNLGSVSNPQTPDLCAWYAFLEAEPTGYRISHRQVAYDRGAVMQALQDVRHPAQGFIALHARGLCARVALAGVAFY